VDALQQLARVETIMDKKSRRRFIRQTAATGGAFALGASVVGAATPVVSAQSAPPRMSKTQKLRALLRKPGLAMAPEGYTVIAARLAEAHGFEVVYVPGSMMSGTYLGVPDWGLISPAEMIDIAGRIARAVSIPVISDADQAGGTSLNVFYSVQQFERAGIAGIHIEDTINPKHADQRAPDRGAAPPAAIESLDRMVLRIRAAADARSDPDFVIIARTDEATLDGILRRGHAFAKAGADVFMPRTIKPDQIDRVTAEVGLPILGVNLPIAEVRGTKLKINVYAGLVSGPATALCDAIMRELKEKGEVANRSDRRLPADTMSRLTNHQVYSQLAEEWTTTP
jgi:2-methylisocitrate lyase-like PEP mutase family enzyme